LINPTVNAVLDMLRANPNLTVFDSEAPDNPPSAYAVVYSIGNGSRADRLSVDFTDSVIRFYVHSVARSPNGARIVADNVRSAILGKTPVVTGRSFHPIYEEFSNIPPLRDETTGYLVVDMTNVYVLSSHAN